MSMKHKSLTLNKIPDRWYDFFTKRPINDILTHAAGSYPQIEIGARAGQSHWRSKNKRSYLSIEQGCFRDCSAFCLMLILDILTTGPQPRKISKYPCANNSISLLLPRPLTRTSLQCDACCLSSLNIWMQSFGRKGTQIAWITIPNTCSLNWALSG